MYTNLKSECKRKNVTPNQIAELLGITYNTACEKLNGKSRLYLDEAFKINKVLFPEYNAEYLFHPLLGN